MPDDARAQFAQRLGQIKEQHQNGTDTAKEQDSSPEVEADPVESVESEAGQDAQTQEGDPDVEQLRQDLQPDSNDDPATADHKKALLRRLEKTERKNAEARKQMQADPEAARKAAAYDLLSQSPDFAKLAGAALQGQAPTKQSDVTADEKALREWFGNDEGFDKMMQLIELSNRKTLYPQLSPAFQALEGLAGRQVDQDWGSLAQTYGDISEYKDKAYATARRLGISLKKALLLESDGEIVKREKEVSDKTKQRKSLTAPTQGGAAAAYSRPKPKLGGTTREDRVRQFAQGVRKHGLDVPWARWGGQGG